MNRLYRQRASTAPIPVLEIPQEKNYLLTEAGIPSCQKYTYFFSEYAQLHHCLLFRIGMFSSVFRCDH